MTDYIGTTIKLPQEVALSLDQQLTISDLFRRTLKTHLFTVSFPSPL